MNISYMTVVLDFGDLQGRLWSFIFIYVCVMVAILLDLVSGVRKARKNGLCRTSIGYRRTIDKVCRYFNTLLVFSVIDAITMAVRFHEMASIPIVPFFTAFWAIYLCFIEVKSINEKPEDKMPVDDLVRVARIFKNIKDPEAFAGSLAEYMSRQRGAKVSTTQKAVPDTLNREPDKVEK